MEAKKFIRTIIGHREIEFYTNSLTLPLEHICQNLCDFYLRNETMNQNDEICLKNLSQITLNVFSNLKNLYLESDSAKAADELSILKEYDVRLIIDSTTKKNGQNLKILREISKLSNIDICFGYSFKEDFLSDNKQYYYDKILNEIRYELSYGFDDFIPSFLGEFILSRNFPNNNEMKLFEVYISLLYEFNIPIFIKLGNKFSNIEFFVNKVKNEFRIKIVFIISPYDTENIENVFFILEKGFSIIICTYHIDILEKNNILSPYYNEDILKFILKIIDKKIYIRQVMISNNINFRIQLKNYGGFGYSNLFINYYPKIIERLNENEKKKIFKDNLISLLSWWEPPKQTEKKIIYIKCSNCKQEKEETDEIIRKHDNIFCSIICLKNYKK